MRSTKTHESLECSEAGCSQRAEKATAADIRCYVNDQHTSAEHKLEAADIKQTGLRLPDEIRHPAPFSRHCSALRNYHKSD